ncbi:hypothetical protein GOODEAATRI_032040 [Goodea atripinnis]|uniref:Uncharacterized protein n=1 Tax=Goodea atripinnis TaxID=208336 RepID=A0ABV0Q2R6_9TELE
MTRKSTNAEVHKEQVSDVKELYSHQRREESGTGTDGARQTAIGDKEASTHRRELQMTACGLLGHVLVIFWLRTVYVFILVCSWIVRQWKCSLSRFKINTLVVCRGSQKKV